MVILFWFFPLYFSAPPFLAYDSNQIYWFSVSVVWHPSPLPLVTFYIVIRDEEWLFSLLVECHLLPCAFSHQTPHSTTVVLENKPRAVHARQVLYIWAAHPLPLSSTLAANVQFFILSVVSLLTHMGLLISCNFKEGHISDSTASSPCLLKASVVCVLAET